MVMPVTGDKTVTTETLVTSEELAFKPHVPERIRDVKTNKFAL